LYLGVAFIFVPLILFLGFYYLWKYPYGKFWHWLVWLIVTTILVTGVSWGIVQNQIFMSNNPDLINALSNADSGYKAYADTLLLKYAIYNGILGLVMGFLWSLILKQFSKHQIHLPF
jgi:RsiW-degrading membrane proteinase PrsW (M82 family)